MPYKTMITVAAAVGLIFALAFAAVPKFFVLGTFPPKSKSHVWASFEALRSSSPSREGWQRCPNGSSTTKTIKRHAHALAQESLTSLLTVCGSRGSH